MRKIIPLLLLLFIAFGASAGILLDKHTRVLHASQVSNKLSAYKSSLILVKLLNNENSIYFSSVRGDTVFRLKPLLDSQLVAGYRIVSYNNKGEISVTELDEQYRLVFKGSGNKGNNLLQIETSELFGKGKGVSLFNIALKAKALNHSYGRNGSLIDNYIRHFDFVTEYDLNHYAASKLWIVSIGIDHYGETFYLNSKRDAKGYVDFFRSSFSKFQQLELPADYIHSFLLLDTLATKDSIESALKHIAAKASPNDYFIFSFSGISTHPSVHNSVDQIYFAPWGLSFQTNGALHESNIEPAKQMISLKALKDFFEFIPARNQLFITESGPTATFKQDFIAALLARNLELTELLNKNRILITPNTMGLDNVNCKTKSVDHGPLHYFITGLDSNYNIFDLFDKQKSNEVALQLKMNEYNCGMRIKNYFSVFFEQEFLSILKSAMPSGKMLSRGSTEDTEVRMIDTSLLGKKYALIVGTDHYQAKNQWDKLNNPIYDAREIAMELKTGYGFDVTLLEDAPMSTILETIRQYSQKLTKKDQLLVYFAGHGDYDSLLLDDGVIVCHDSRSSKEDPFHNSYINYSKLGLILNNLPPKQILLMLDVCFGGTFDRRVAGMKTREKTYETLNSNSYFADKLKYVTRKNIASCGNRTVPDGYAGKHSPFAYYFLELLRGRGGEKGFITAQQIMAHLEGLPSGPKMGSFGDDEAGSDFVFIYQGN